MKWITATFPNLHIHGVAKFEGGVFRSTDPEVLARMAPWVGRYGITQVSEDTDPPDLPLRDPWPGAVLDIELFGEDGKVRESVLPPRLSDVELRAALVARGGGIYRLRDYFPSPLGVIDSSTDVTPYINAALADMYADGGGTLEFPALELLVAGQIVIPNDTGATNPFTTPRQPSMIWKGAAGFHTGQVQSLASHTYGGTRLRMTFQDPDYNDAKIVTRGLGRLAIRDLTMFDPAATKQSTPFLFTTNTTLHVTQVAFIGSANGGAGTKQDAIVLGGTRKHDASNPNGYDTPDSAFQGYGTVIERCYFDATRRAVYGRSYVNHVVIRDNFMDKRNGTDLASGACIELHAGLDTLISGADGDNDTADLIMGNYMNGLNGYAHQVKLIGASYCNIAFNGSPDQHNNASFVSFVGAYSFTDNASNVRLSTGNLILNNFTSGVAKPHLFEDAACTGQNFVIGDRVGGTFLLGPVRLRAGAGNPNLVDKLTIDGKDTGLRIKPSTAHTSDATAVMRVSRADDDASMPGVSVFEFLQNGAVSIRGASAGFFTFTNVAGADTAKLDGNGRRWRGLGVGDLTMDATSGSWNNFWGAGARFYTGTSGAGGAAGPLRMRIGAAIDGFELGAASDLKVERDANNCLAVNRPIKALTAVTASRPAASSVSAGSWMFDTTLGKPIWSTGSAWVDAMGSAV